MKPQQTLKITLIHIAFVKTLPCTMEWQDWFVSPFLLEYNDTENVKLCSAITSWKSYGSKAYLQLFGQGLWFGDRMKRCLIKPNQCRAFGMKICDDTTNPNREMGFYTKDVCTQLGKYGSVATLTTRTQILEDLDTCTYVHMSDKDNWYPTDTTSNIFSSALK